MGIGTAFHPRTSLLNRKMSWREWAGYYAASQYADHHDIEYNAIREAAALIDVSPLYKYRVSGPDAVRLIDRVITRDATKLQPGQVYYTCWCDEQGKVVDDALQGPLSRHVLEAATEAEWSDLRYFRRRASSVRGIQVDVSRTGYTGDLGYELWGDAERAPELWDALVDAGRAFGIRPAGMLALDVVRVEAGLILLEVDYTSSRHAMIPEQAYSPFELGVLGTLTKLDKPAPFTGQRALRREQANGGPPRRLVGLEADWEGIESLFAARDLPPALSPATSREPVPVHDGRRQVGRATSTAWSPILKKAVALASIRADHAEPGTPLQLEWTVEARRGRVPATVVDLPFFDPPRKRA